MKAQTRPPSGPSAVYAYCVYVYGRICAQFFRLFPILSALSVLSCAQGNGRGGKGEGAEGGRRGRRRTGDEKGDKKRKNFCKRGQNKLTNGSGYYIIDAFTCGRGGTGRRARLRILWLTPCRFNSCRPHHLCGMLHKTWQYPVYFLSFWIIILRFSRFLPRLACVLAC